MSDGQDIWSRAEPIPEAGCFIWSGATGGTGYGHKKVNGQTIRVHRLAWMQVFGPIKSGMCVLHRCDTKLCINPHHLFLGTIYDNNKDRSHKGRTKNGGVKGEAHISSKLSNKQVKEIRSLCLSNKKIAEKYGVSSSAVSDIKTRRTWKHIL